MKHPFFSLLLAMAMVVGAPLVYASLIHFHVDLNGANESPPTPSLGIGIADLELDTTAQTLTGHIAFSGLTGFTSAAHIHCCLPSPFAPGNVGVATVVPAFPGFPLNVQSGTDDFVLNLASASAYNSAFVNMFPGGVPSAEAAFIAGLIAGETYLNIHTAAPIGFPGGEIRGFVVAVPEPMTTSLLVLGLAAAAFVSRRRRRT